MFLWERIHGTEIETARTIAVNTLVFFEIFYLFNSRYITESVVSRRGLFGNKYVVIAVCVLVLFQLAFTYLTPMQVLFGTMALDAATWLRIIAVSFSVFVLVEIEKTIMRGYYRHNHHGSSMTPPGVSGARY